MTKINETYEQIARYLSGNMTNTELEQFNSWLSQATPEETALFEATKKLWEKSYSSTQSFQPNIEQAIKQIRIKRQFRQRKTIHWERYAATIIVVITSALSIWHLSKKSTELIKQAQNEIELVDLPDGSKIWLSPGTSISYQSDFMSHREIRLSGKAFFEVAKKNNQPFTVFSANTKTQVLGTSFNLETRDDGQVAIQVTTGKVAFSEIDANDPVLLIPGNEASYAPKREQKIQTRLLEDQNYRAWQTKQLTFNNTSITELFEVLSDYYQTEFIISDNLSKCRFTTSFEDQNLQEVLEILQLTGNLTINKQTQGYQITGSPCK